MIDREIDVKDEEITLAIPIPLYFGLAATMLGIIFGLWAMPDINGDNFSTAINTLINGVKWAMGASLTGLACTIIITLIYKTYKSEISK